MYKFYYLSRTGVTIGYTTQGLWVIKGSSVYEGQESTYSGSEDLWWRGTELCLQPRDSEDEGQRYISMVLRYQRTRVPRGAWPGTQVYLSKAKLGIYNEYLGLYICFWDRGCMSHSGGIVRQSTRSWEIWVRRRISMRYKYTVMKEMSQKKDKCEIQVHSHERNESEGR